MQQENEQDRTEKEGATFDDAKRDSSSCHVRVTKPSSDLSRYIVDKFHPLTAKRKQVPFESIDLSICRPSERCLAFCTTDYYLLHSHNDNVSSCPAKPRGIKSHGMSTMGIVHLQNMTN